MRIVIDISCLLNTQFVSGIQRVVIETTLGLIEKGCDVSLLKYDKKNDTFYIIDNQDFIDTYKFCKTKKIINKKRIDVDYFRDVIFLDIDSTWSIDNKKRSILFPIIKEHGGKIVSYLYDIIPLEFPEFADQKLMYDFIIYVSAIIQYADVILTETESGVANIKKLCENIGVPCPKCYSTWLGADSIDTEPEGIVREEVVKIATMKYILMVGTVEPRKNHKLVLDAFDKKLFNEGLNLVFAGREGWNNDEFLERIHKHHFWGDKFQYFNDLNDKEIQYLYENAFFLAFPSYSEGFGLPIIEAYQNGTPVIGANIGVTREVAGDMGVYFEQDNYEDFVAKIMLYINNQYEYNKLLDKIKGFATPTWNDMVNKIEKILTLI